MITTFYQHVNDYMNVLGLTVVNGKVSLCQSFLGLKEVNGFAISGPDVIKDFSCSSQLSMKI